MALLPAAGAVQAAVVGEVLRVGYLTTGGAVVRTGAWTPVVVELALQDQPSFDGLLRLRQFDRDGDIYVDSVPVHLSDAGNGARQRYWLHTVANPQEGRAQDFAVELLASTDPDGANARLVEVVSGDDTVTAMTPRQQPEPISDDDWLILDVTDGALGRIRRMLDADQLDRFDRRMIIAHAAPDDLPANWAGLEMVDCLVWEKADPSRVSGPQLQALVHWVEQGGQLVLAAGRTADAVARSEVLAPLLPVQIGRIRSTSELPTVRARLLGIAGEGTGAYGTPVVYAECAVVDDPAVKRVLYDEAAESTFVASRRVGRGRLVFVAAELDDLLADDNADAARFFERLLELRQAPMTDDSLQVMPLSLFRHLDREVGFYQAGGMLLVLAILFAVSYVLAATLGAWKLLQRRDLLKQSWTALAVMALAASLISLIGVQALHGVSRRVQQLTVVDGVANQAAAQATAYFGVRTGTHSRLDFWLPSDYRLQNEPALTNCTLKPMLAGEQGLDEAATFTDPSRYWLKPATAELHDVPVRATLKQFEGRWQGDLRGTVRSEVYAGDVAVPRTVNATDESVEVYTVAPGSWLENGLDVDLVGCQLFVAAGDVMAAQTFAPQAQRTGDIAPMRVFPIGELKAGERIDLYARINLDEGGQLLPLERYDALTLKALARTWGQKFISVGNVTRYGQEPVPQYRFDHYQTALLLLTVLSDIDPTIFEPSPIYGLRTFSRMRARQLDVAGRVQRRAALLVGFAADAGPVRLGARSAGGADYAVLEPGAGGAHTMYRFLIPIGAAGKP